MAGGKRLLLGILAFLLAALLTASCGLSKPATSTAPPVTKPTPTPSLEVAVEPQANEAVTCLEVEFANTPDGIARGLAGRSSVEGGMLFDFAETVTVPFWMKDTFIPLSIAFVSKDRVIVDIQDMEPLSVESCIPAEPYRYALEVNRGYFAENGITIGNKVEFRKIGQDTVLVVFGPQHCGDTLHLTAMPQLR